MYVYLKKKNPRPLRPHSQYSQVQINYLSFFLFLLHFKNILTQRTPIYITVGRRGKAGSPTRSIPSLVNNNNDNEFFINFPLFCVSSCLGPRLIQSKPGIIDHADRIYSRDVEIAWGPRILLWLITTPLDKHGRVFLVPCKK